MITFDLSCHRARRLVRAGIAASVAALLTGGLAGCAGSGNEITPGERGPEAFKPLSVSLDKVGYRWDWSGFPLPAANARVQFLEAWPDAIATQDSSSKVTVMEASSGRVRWSGDVATPLTRFVGLSRDHDGSADRLICSGEAEAFLLDMATGNVVSRQRYEKVVNTPPLLLGGLAIYGTPTGEILAHRLSNGTKAWGYQASGPIEYAPILASTMIVGATQAGNVSMVDALSGSLAARNRMYGGSAGTLATDGALVFIASLDQSIYAFATSGPLIWQHRTSRPLAFPPVCIGNRVYCHTADEGLACFDAGSGRIVWENRDVSGAVIGSRRGELVVWNGRDLSILEVEHGATVERVTLPNITAMKFDRFDGGNLYAVNRAGVVGRFVPKK